MACDELLHLARPRLQQSTVAQARFLTTSAPRAIVLETTFSNSNSPPVWSQTREKIRLVPASPSYFTGNSDFFDNWLALQELLRRYETLPTVPREEAPSAKWKSLAEYRAIVGGNVKAAKYKKLVNILDRLNCINPTLIPEDVKTTLDLYKRKVEKAASQEEPKTLDLLGRAHGLGRRKTSVANVWVLEGDGRVLVNGKPLVDVFDRVHDRESAVWPLLSTGRMSKYNVWAIVSGGGKTGQAEAFTLGLARALLVHEPALKPALRRGEPFVHRTPSQIEN
jgi:small subunit ribosomal protein S9